MTRKNKLTPEPRPRVLAEPGAFRVPRGVKLKNMDLTVSRDGLSFFLARGETDA